MAAGAAADHVSPGGQGWGSFDVVPGSAVLVEESGDEPETPEAEQSHKLAVSITWSRATFGAES
jgi:hypothetical protein